MILHLRTVLKQARDLVVGDLLVDPETGVAEAVGAAIKRPGQQLVLLCSEDGARWVVLYDSARVQVVGRKEGDREALPALAAPDWRDR